ncbi:phosphotransferase family protein [Paenibacillus contaminans]|uniref:Aminoglycoside phosphotransferase n=1 Tax=Paenibacillus contaminans TaxID=450362 RepID=A0A329MS30_9BACL|nr:aminoglycoside phosphotransferase family protein [Paenibacillus contaminans]RAV22745.1 aminoglycoside phosphotransferase [Paenibacillus contaminans]
MSLGIKIGEGNTAEIFAWGDGKVIKLFREFMPRSTIEQEWSVSQAILSAGLPVPRVFGLEEVDGKTGIIYERIGASSMLERLLENPALAEEMGCRMAVLHAAMHSRIDVRRMTSQKNALEKAILHADLLQDKEKDEIVARLHKLPEGKSLCHGDFHPGNVLLGKSGPIVIDWSTGVAGNASADAMRTRMMLEHAVLPPETAGDWSRRLEAIRMKLCKAYLEGYLKLTETDKESIEEWELPVAAARLDEGVPAEEKRILTDRIRALLHSHA